MTKKEQNHSLVELFNRMPENVDLADYEVVDDEVDAHANHRRISRYARSEQRFNNSMKGKN
ncbi:hypothetical protein ACFO26_00320 [Lactococcus nasutitermitis]|uniref:YfhD family protein n=1 Tax=Lactococcus nasutitermitis TaxID=1652957 RepID=A0ABV9JBK0_9LACT|nr:hypothetical protein [Lactococcus nasutitermitis]